MALAISPSSATCPSGDSVAFSASGGTGTYVFSILVDNSGGASVDPSTGIYTSGAAPGATDTVRVTDFLLATSDADVDVDGTPLDLEPLTPVVDATGTVNFSTTGGIGSKTYSISINNSGGATIDPSSGLYTAGPTGGVGGSVQDTVRVTDGGPAFTETTVTVNPVLVISPPSATVYTGVSQTFTPSGGSGTGYAWSLSVNNSGGSIDSSSGLYVAGATGSVTDTVELQDDSGSSAFANVTVNTPQLLSITPTSIDLGPENTTTFSGVGGVAPYSFAITVNNTGGSIDPSSGLYTAGTSAGDDTVEVTDSALSTADGTTHVTEVQLSPSNVTLLAGAAQIFTAIGGSGTGYVFSFVDNESGGSIASNGHYSAGHVAGVSDTVQAVDSLGNSGTANVNVEGVTVSPPSPTVPPRGTQAFTASGGSGTGYTFDLSLNNSGGAVTSDGHYTAGATSSVSDVVRATDSFGNVGNANVSVGPDPSISPANPHLPPGGSQVFTASSGSGTGYIFDLLHNNSGGSIASNGHYTAGTVSSTTDTVRVTDSLTNIGTTAVIVGAGVSVAPATPTVAVADTVTFIASGGSDVGYAWSLSINNSGGSIDSVTGQYVAGPTYGVSDTVHVVDSLGNTATTTVLVVRAHPFNIANVVNMGLSTIRVTFSIPPRALSSDGLQDALNPDRYSLSGPERDYVIEVVKVYGDAGSVDCILGAPLSVGSWTLIASGIIDAQGIEVL